MTDKPPIKVIILGAGCSADYGYPLGSEFFTQLQGLLPTLSDKARRIRECIEGTLHFLKHTRAETIDELANLILDGKCDEILANGHAPIADRFSAVKSAKIAASALFLSKEANARELGLRAYKVLIEKMFPGSDSWRTKLDRSEYRLLTFNYDRLFEMAFLDRFNVGIGQNPLYWTTVLNSGFPPLSDEPVEISPDRFCFLKLHGSIGVMASNWLGLQRVFHDSAGPIRGQEKGLVDEHFFSQAGDAREPLIIFPWEKHFIQSQRKNSFPARDYIIPVWKHAAKVIAEASEIRVIGYSFHHIDAHSLIAMLANAVNCKRLIIQNLEGECARIETMLRVEYPEVRAEIDRYPLRF